MDNIDKIIEKVSNINPYKQVGNADSYSKYNEGWSDACDILGEQIKEELKKVSVGDTLFEFLYNENCHESAARTVSIHKTIRGAEMAMEFHKSEIKKIHFEMMGDDYEFPFDYNQWWGVKEVSVEE